MNSLLTYLKLWDNEAAFGKFSLVQHRFSEFMRLDASAMKALHLMPPSSQSGSRSSITSLYALLNQCCTSQGSRLLQLWLRQPLLSRPEIRKFFYFEDIISTIGRIKAKCRSNSS
jgi:DNA mismatch repair protein MSH2